MSQEFDRMAGGAEGVDRQYMSMNWLDRRNLYEHASIPLDFYEEGYKAMSDMSSTNLDGLVVDLGCFDGQLFLDAIRQSGIDAHLIGIDPYEEAYLLALSHLANKHLADGEVVKIKSLKLANYPSNFSFVKAKTEDLPLQDNSVSKMSANFMMYLVKDQLKTLDEIKRVLEPKGLVTFSTNGVANMAVRHLLEGEAVAELSRDLGKVLTIPLVPARSFLSENAPEVLETAGFEIVDMSIHQQSPLIITPGERYDDYISAIWSAGESLPPEVPRKAWADAVARVTKPIIDGAFRTMERANLGVEFKNEPFFTDHIDRQAFICRVK